MQGAHPPSSRRPHKPQRRSASRRRSNTPSDDDSSAQGRPPSSPRTFWDAVWRRQSVRVCVVLLLAFLASLHPNPGAVLAALAGWYPPGAAREDITDAAKYFSTLQGPRFPIWRAILNDLLFELPESEADPIAYPALAPVLLRVAREVLVPALLQIGAKLFLASSILVGAVMMMRSAAPEPCRLALDPCTVVAGGSAQATPEATTTPSATSFARPSPVPTTTAVPESMRRATPGGFVQHAILPKPAPHNGPVALVRAKQPTTQATAPVITTPSTLPEPTAVVVSHTSEPSPLPLSPTYTPASEPVTVVAPVVSPTANSSREPAAVPSLEPSASATATPEPTATATTSPSLEPSRTPSATAEPVTPSATATATSTLTPSLEPTATATVAPSLEPSRTPSATAEPVTPSATATATSTLTPSLEPTATATVAPSLEPSRTPSATAEPVTPSLEPSVTPSLEPTAAITPEPPTATVTATPHQCLAQPRDLVLTIDTSGSTAPSLPLVKEPTRQFLRNAGTVSSRVGLVSFSAEAILEQPLTTQPEEVVTAVERLRASSGTRIDFGILAAFDALTAERHREVDRVIILITDGHAQDYEDEALQAAATATDQGVRLIIIGLGHDIRHSLLEALASSEQDYYSAATIEELDAVYRRIAASLGCTTLP
jgi:uncharacterized protein YegL